MITVIQTALELGLINAITVLALYLSYTMLDFCDLSTDGCFTLGASTGAFFVLAGHPYLSLPAAVIAGMLSGLVVATLHTRLGIEGLLAGIIVNTALYSVNILLMGQASIVNLNRNATVFTMMKDLLEGTFLDGQQVIVIALITVAVIMLFLYLFLKTRLGLAIRATGNNMEMVRTSSIDPSLMITIGLTISGGITALSGCLLAQAQKSANIDMGSGMVTIALASLLIGRIVSAKGSQGLKLTGNVIGAILFRMVYMLALRLHMPAFMLKFMSALIVTVTLAVSYLHRKGNGGKERNHA